MVLATPEAMACYVNIIIMCFLNTLTSFASTGPDTPVGMMATGGLVRRETARRMVATGHLNLAMEIAAVRLENRDQMHPTFRQAESRFEIL
jgi:hypothetical protein